MGEEKGGGDGGGGGGGGGYGMIGVLQTIGQTVKQGRGQLPLGFHTLLHACAQITDGSGAESSSSFL